MFLEKLEIQDNNLRPFVKWAGGKTQLINQIAKFIPFEKEDSFLYVEPFVGGGAMLFWILKKYPNLMEVVINDVNPDLILTYRVIKFQIYDLLEVLYRLDKEFNNLPYNSVARKKYYYQKRQEYNNGNVNAIYRAALFIFLNKTCFNGLYRVNANGMFNVPIGRYKRPKIYDKANLLSVHRALQKVTILQGDFEQTLKYATKKTFYYLDPPYRPISKTSSFTSYTNNGFSDADQIRLKRFCDKLNNLGAKWILSNSDPKNYNKNDNFFDKLYKEYEIIRIPAKRYINSKADKRGKINEIIIKNF